VPKKEIDELYLHSPYYLAPDGEVGQHAFAVIREAIRKEGMVALGRVVFLRDPPLSQKVSPPRHSAKFSAITAAPLGPFSPGSCSFSARRRAPAPEYGNGAQHSQTTWR
jgi:hypothetical protein